MKAFSPAYVKSNPYAETLYGGFHIIYQYFTGGITMSNCFCQRCCCPRFTDNDLDQRQAQAQAQAQLQAQLQAQRQFQVAVQDADQDTNQRSIFREIGNNNVDIDIDNVSVAVAVLVAVGVLTGALDATELRSALDGLRSR